MKTSPEGVDLVQYFEHCALAAYPDPKTGSSPWTIGWGRTAGVERGDTCTGEEADEWLAEDLGEFERGVERLLKVDTSQGEFDALVSFAYNLGLNRLRGSTLLIKLNGDAPAVGIADEFLKWVSPGSGVERGLRRRRVAERALFLGGNWRSALDAHIAAGG